MVETWEVWLADQRGYRIALLDTILTCDVIQTVNSTWAWTIVLSGDYDFSILRKDYLVEIWRTTNNAKKLLIIGVIRIRDISEDIQGIPTITISGPDRGTDLLQTRIVAYAAGSAQADKTDYADDMMKAVVRENLGSLATDADRDLSTYDFSIADDISLGPSLTKAFSKQNVLDTLKAISDSAVEAGSAVYFAVVPVFLGSGGIGYTFETYIDQIGQDRRANSGNQTIFGREWGNLAEPHLVYDDSDEVTVVYCGGQGEGVNREIVEQENTGRSGDSVWNRREGWIDARDATATAALTARALEELNSRRGRLRFTGTLLDVPGSQYGVDWGLGDRITADYMGMQFNGLIKSVHLTLNSDGSEIIEAKLEVEQ